MIFTEADVARLYGRRIFCVAENVSGTIVWRNKPAAKVTFFLSRAEYGHEAYTTLVKNIVQALSIPTEAVGFGMVEGVPPLDAFFQMPTPFGLVFGILTPGEYVRDGRELYVVPSVRDMTQDRKHKLAAWNAMKKFKDRL
ncbi:MAG: hypothetical protein RMM53_10295 [Bacteroidia bacterium]|nr:hypothetical protein [Bacteroidia bacterium]